MKVNLCGVGLDGFVNVDISLKADKIRDLSWMRLPFKDNSVDYLICMSAINYFTKKRAQKIINDVYRVLKPNGVCRFGTQDLAKICSGYLSNDFSCERVNEWFRGYKSNGRKCKYVYDSETLWMMFYETGFREITPCAYKNSPNDIGQYDNRPEQMFFIEAKKLKKNYSTG